jgi:hypothetical protein
MAAILRLLFAASMLAAGLWSIDRWRATDPILAFPESALVVLLVGSSVLAVGAFYGLSLLLRSFVALGLVDLLLRSASPFMPEVANGLLARAAATGAVVGAVFLFTQRLDWQHRARQWDAPVFFALGSLFVAIGTRDALGADAWPYALGNIGIWMLLMLTIVTAARAFFRPLRSRRHVATAASQFTKPS